MLWPLAGVRPENYTQGGFDYLDWNSYPGYAGDAFHPGTDFNSGGWGDADCGSETYCLTPGIVRAIIDHTNSYGLHVWIEHAGDIWTHYCHLSAGYVWVGQALQRGDVVGLCGKSATGKASWPYCHLHFEVMRGAPPVWNYWPSGQSQAAVAARYLDPVAWAYAQDQAAVSPVVTPIGVIDVQNMTDEELTPIAEKLWGRVPFNPDSAIAKAYLTDLRAGKYRGAPVGGETAVADGRIIQRFKRGSAPIIAVYVDGKGAGFAE